MQDDAGFDVPVDPCLSPGREEDGTSEEASVMTKLKELFESGPPISSGDFFTDGAFSSRRSPPITPVSRSSYDGEIAPISIPFDGFSSMDIALFEPSEIDPSGCYLIDSSHYHVGCKHWEREIAMVALTSAQKLGVHNPTAVQAVPSHLLVCLNGSQLAVQRHPRHQNEFATLMVQVPSECEGGDLVLYMPHDTETNTLRLHKGAHEYNWAAFFGYSLRVAKAQLRHSSADGLLAAHGATSVHGDSAGSQQTVPGCPATAQDAFRRKASAIALGL